MVITLSRNEFERRLDVAIDSFEQHCLDDEATDVRDFLPTNQTAADRQIALELLCVDLQYRWRGGRPKRLPEYCHDFPEWLADSSTRGELAFEEYRMASLAGEQPTAARFAAEYAIDTSSWPVATESSRGLEDPGSAVPPELLDLEWLDQIDAFPAVGDQVAEFTIREELGRGAFAIVYLAEQQDLAHRLVVLKITLGKSVEPDHLARLQHTHIMPIYSLHHHQGLQVICMPYFGRRTLQHMMRQRAQPAQAEPPATSLERINSINGCLMLLQQIAAGLQHAHAKGVVHRDLKPANILVGDDGSALLLDFNLSDRLTTDGRAYLWVGGTLPYLAPEHLQAIQHGGTFTAGSDVYSLGVILYELLTGTRPFAMPQGQFDECIERMIQERQHAPAAANLRNSAVPPSVAALVQRMLAPSPDRRYQSMDQVLADLDCHFTDRPLRYAANPSLRERVAKFCRRHPRLTSNSVVGGTAIMCFILMSFWLLASSNRLAETRAVQQFDRATAALPELRAALSCPLIDNKSAEQAWQRVWQVVSDNQLDIPASQPAAAALTGNPVSRRAWPVSRRAWSDTMSQYLFLASVHWQRVGSSATDPLDRQTAVAEAVRWNKLAQQVVRWAEGTLSPDSALAWQAARLSSDSHTSAGRAETPALIPSTAPAGLFNAGIFLLTAEDYRAAIPQLERLRDTAPHDASTWLLLGNAYAGAERLDEAAGCYTVCISMWPDSYLGYLYRGLCRLQQQQPQAAVDDFTAALNGNPDLTAARMSRAAALSELGRLADAVADLTIVLQSADAPTRVYLLRSDLRRRLGDVSGAEQDRRQGLELTPQDEVSWVQRGLARATTDPQGAIADFQAANRLRPGSRLALRNLAYVYGERLNDLEQSISWLDALIELHGHVDDYVSRGVYRARLGRADLARSDAQTALKLKRTPKVLFQTACIYALLSDDTDSATRVISLLDEALAQEPQWVRLAAVDPDLERIRGNEAFQALVQATQARLQRHSAIRADIAPGDSPK